VLRKTDTEFTQGDEVLLPALNKFEIDWQNIQLGQARSKTYTRRNQQWLQLCSDYPDAGVNILHLRINPIERIHWLESGLLAAKKLGDIQMESSHLGSLSSAYLDIGKSDLALKFGKQQLRCARQNADRLDKALALGNIAPAYYQSNEFHKAKNNYQKALSIFRSLDDYLGEGLALQGLGISTFRLGDKDLALDFFYTTSHNRT
jgi:tetratricopeptide (TPR) repeat protein